MSVGAVLLEASVVSQTTERWAATRWITTGGLVLFVVALGSTLWMNRAALRVLDGTRHSPRTEKASGGRAGPRRRRGSVTGVGL